MIPFCNLIRDVKEGVELANNASPDQITHSRAVCLMPFIATVKTIPLPQCAVANVQGHQVICDSFNCCTEL